MKQGVCSIPIPRIIYNSLYRTISHWTMDNLSMFTRPHHTHRSSLLASSEYFVFYFDLFTLFHLGFLTCGEVLVLVLVRIPLR